MGCSGCEIYASRTRSETLVWGLSRRFVFVHVAVDGLLGSVVSWF